MIYIEEENIFYVTMNTSSHGGTAHLFYSITKCSNFWRYVSFKLRASLGFDLVLGGKLNFDDIDEAYLLNNSNNDVNTAWPDLKTAIGIAVPIY